MEINMIVKTKYFGEVDLKEDKIISFDNGIIGFEYCKKFTLIYDNKEGKRPNISWLQSIDELVLSIPVINPFLLKEDYNPVVEDELIKSLGEITQDSIMVLVSVTIPPDIKSMSANLKAPFIINPDTKKGTQIIADNSEYEIKYYFYDKLKALKDEKEAKVC
jgi:flagellar assembly factor FliW